ncbi:MAG TPA: histidine phosphatase family protein [Acidimicrobiia bacterium]|nr:histidine phosphatase family protein [Acidimicrobiia bacterium]
MTVLISFVRHGQTAWNAERRLLGWTDLPLDEIGRSQAVELGARIERAAYDAVWASDLRRAVETARLAGWDPTLDGRLREIDFGSLDGLVWSQLEPALRDELAAFDGFVAPGGESTEHFVERLVGFLDGLPAGSHLVVTHGGVIRAVTRLCGAPGAFPDHAAIHTVNWSRRLLVDVQTPTT